MRRLTTLIVTIAALVVGAAVPASADRDFTPVDLVVAVSGAEGFDNRGWDFDILRDALLATELADDVAAADDISVFAPNDRAFKRLARDLGWDGSDGEAGAFGFIAEATGFESASSPGILADVLLYHVGTDQVDVRDLFHGSVPTLLGPRLHLRWFRVVDADRNDRDARVTFPFLFPTSNGPVVGLDRVLRPIDLP